MLGPGDYETMIQMTIQHPTLHTYTAIPGVTGRGCPAFMSLMS